MSRDRSLNYFIYDKNNNMAKKLYVGNLSYSVTDEALKEYFSQAGAVESVLIITDRMSGRPKGFGFVEMTTDEEAAKAIEMFNGKEFDSRPLTVNEARPKEEGASRPRSGGFGGNRGGGSSRGGFGGGQRSN
jgi:RNA recognition motif-containing protein